MSQRSFKVENSLLEVGAEVFRLKHELTRILEQQEHFSKSLRGLKTLLDEKGVITAEDFEAAVDIVDVIGRTSHRQESSSSVSSEGDWLKKTTH